MSTPAQPDDMFCDALVFSHCELESLAEWEGADVDNLDKLTMMARRWYKVCSAFGEFGAPVWRAEHMAEQPDLWLHRIGGEWNGWVAVRHILDNGASTGDLCVAYLKCKTMWKDGHAWSPFPAPEVHIPHNCKVGCK